MLENRRFVGRISICGLVVFAFIMVSVNPLVMNSRAAIPVPHNAYGHALDVQGMTFPEGELITAWIDGVSYGWNMTFRDLLDPNHFNQSGKYDIDTNGNQLEMFDPGEAPKSVMSPQTYMMSSTP